MTATPSNQDTKPNKKAVLFLVLFLCAAFLCSLFFLLRPTKQSAQLTAEIYQNGTLLQRISLNQIEEAYSFTLTAPDGGSNEIQVTPNSIRISDADCPDRLCVKQGAIHNTGLPLVCLPHRLVIQLTDSSSATADIISY